MANNQSMTIAIKSLYEQDLCLWLQTNINTLWLNIVQVKLKN